MMRVNTIIGRKRFMTVDTLGLVLRVLVTAANVPERSGGEQVLKRVKRMDTMVSRLTTIWADGGFDGPAFMMWVMDFCRWIVQVVLRPEQAKGFVLVKKRPCGRAYFRLGYGVSPIGQQTLNFYRRHQRRSFTLS
jgi:transposase